MSQHCIKKQDRLFYARVIQYHFLILLIYCSNTATNPMTSSHAPVMYLAWTECCQVSHCCWEARSRTYVLGFDALSIFWFLFLFSVQRNFTSVYLPDCCYCLWPVQGWLRAGSTLPMPSPPCHSASLFFPFYLSTVFLLSEIEALSTAQSRIHHGIWFDRKRVAASGLMTTAVCSYY